MYTSSHVCLISILTVAFLDNISSNPNLRLENLRQSLFSPSPSRKSEGTLESDADYESGGDVKTMPLHMNITDLYEICKSYNQSNHSPAVINNQLGKVLSHDGLSKKTRLDINVGLESSCLSFFKLPPVMHLVEEHLRLSKRNTTNPPSHPKPKAIDKLNPVKSKILGKPVPAYNVSGVSGGVGAGVSGGTGAGVTGGTGAVTTEKSGPVRRESGEADSKAAEALNVFPNKNSGSIVVQVSGHEPVVTPSPDLNAPYTFPDNPQYDMTNITTFQKKIAILMEKINQIVEHNNTHDNINGSLEIIKVINELKVNLDQWSHSLNSSNQTSGIEIQHETMQTNLLSSKVYLAQLIHELVQNKTDPSELLCKINNLYEEIKNLTNIDIGFFNIAMDSDEPRLNCSEPILWNCTTLPDGNTTATEGQTPLHAETEIEDLHFHPNLIGVLAIGFAVLAIFSYIGLISWRFFLERKYGTRQLLMNEDTEYYDSAPDNHPFEIRSEQL